MTGWAGPPTRRTGDDLLERQDVPVEGGPAVGGEPGRRARPLADESLADLDVAGVRQRGELLGQGGVGQADTIAQDPEVRPSGRGEEGHQRQPGGGVDQLVEPGRDHPRPPDRRTRKAVWYRISICPPTTNTTMATALAIVPDQGTPADFRLSPVASPTPSTAAAKAAIPASTLGTGPGATRSRRGGAPRSARDSSPLMTSVPTMNSARPIQASTPCPRPDSTAAESAIVRTAVAHQYQPGTAARRITCSRRRPISLSARAASAGSIWSFTFPPRQYFPTRKVHEGFPARKCRRRRDERAT